MYCLVDACGAQEQKNIIDEHCILSSAEEKIWKQRRTLRRDSQKP